MTDSIVVNLSDLTDYTTKLFIRKADIWCSTGISVLLEIDATADELVCYAPLGALEAHVDFTGFIGGEQGLPKQTAGATGDLVLTTLSAASGDEVFVAVEYYAI